MGQPDQRPIDLGRAHQLSFFADKGHGCSETQGIMEEPPRNILRPTGFTESGMKILAAVLLGLSSLYGQTCVPAKILPNGSAKGTLNDTSCRLTDGSAYAAYRLDLAARGQIRIDLSTGSDFLLILRDRSGMKIESGTAIRRAIEAGSYTLLVNAREPGQAGEFAVQAQFTIEAGVICSSWASLGLEQAADGMVGGSGCAFPDGTPYEGYLVTTFGAGMLTMSASGGSRPFGDRAGNRRQRDRVGHRWVSVPWTATARTRL